MLRRFRARSGNLRLTAAGIFAALAVLALAPAAAAGACASSVASGPSNFSDPGGDAESGAPDIGTVNNALDTGCRLRTEVLLLPPALQPSQSMVVEYDRDERTAAPEVPDVRVYVDAGGAALDDGVNPRVPLPTFGQYGFAVTLDQLGIATSPMRLGVAVRGVFDPTPGVPGDETYDHAPDTGRDMHRVPVAFTPVAPPAPPAPPPVVPAAKPRKSCVVPKVKRLTVRKAKRRLKRAGCKYKVRGRGRVRWTSPKAGTRTIKTVRVRAKPKRRR